MFTEQPSMSSLFGLKPKPHSLSKQLTKMLIGPKLLINLMLNCMPNKSLRYRTLNDFVKME
jgi:hypothetical protein